MAHMTQEEWLSQNPSFTLIEASKNKAWLVGQVQWKQHRKSFPREAEHMKLIANIDRQREYITNEWVEESLMRKEKREKTHRSSSVSTCSTDASQHSRRSGRSGSESSQQRRRFWERILTLLGIGRGKRASARNSMSTEKKMSSQNIISVPGVPQPRKPAHSKKFEQGSP
eukprot:CAMPEP_0171501484 /NCGR_PEP_ID=MMETSP0958-20121227/9584_1 /TAXON_ID=87120 /ORGANISM="Aurantiochytrium limacinum, Strain ATCCMYA-1381" /LENGTH=169 /DNA_ID=CAMNT_0012036305 /DNA_START=61 /DNA_END=567 /DNA_ORIENTATION=+